MAVKKIKPFLAIIIVLIFTLVIARRVLHALAVDKRRAQKREEVLERVLRREKAEYEDLMDVLKGDCI